jgi:hypothetical protein
LLVSLLYSQDLLASIEQSWSELRDVLQTRNKSAASAA